MFLYGKKKATPQKSGVDSTFKDPESGQFRVRNHHTLTPPQQCKSRSVTDSVCAFTKLSCEKSDVFPDFITIKQKSSKGISSKSIVFFSKMEKTYFFQFFLDTFFKIPTTVSCKKNQKSSDLVIYTSSVLFFATFFIKNITKMILFGHESFLFSNCKFVRNFIEN